VPLNCTAARDASNHDLVCVCANSLLPDARFRIGNHSELTNSPTCVIAVATRGGATESRRHSPLCVTVGGKTYCEDGLSPDCVVGERVRYSTP
jgi:hypothetical protein